VFLIYCACQAKDDKQVNDSLDVSSLLGKRNNQKVMYVLAFLFVEPQMTPKKCSSSFVFVGHLFVFVGPQATRA